MAVGRRDHVEGNDFSVMKHALSADGDSLKVTGREDVDNIKG
jgi:hypothetical protein